MPSARWREEYHLAVGRFFGRRWRGASRSSPKELDAAVSVFMGEDSTARVAHFEHPG